MDHHAGENASKRSKIDSSVRDKTSKDSTNITHRKPPPIGENTVTKGKDDTSSRSEQISSDRHLPPRNSGSTRHHMPDSSDPKEEGSMEKKRDREKKRRSEITHAVERLSQTVAKIEQPSRGAAWNLVNDYTSNSPSSGPFPHPSGSPSAVTTIGATNSSATGDIDNKRSTSNSKNAPSSLSAASGVGSSSSFNPRQQQQNRTHVISNACDLIDRLYAENIQLKKQLRLFVGSGAPPTNSQNLAMVGDDSNSNSSNLLSNPKGSRLENPASGGTAPTPVSTSTTGVTSSALSRNPPKQGTHYFPQQQPNAPSPFVPILSRNENRTSTSGLRNRLPPLSQQRQQSPGGDHLLQLHQLQQIQQQHHADNLGNPVLNQQSLLMQHQFLPSGGVDGREMERMQNVLGNAALRAPLLPPHQRGPGNLLDMVVLAGGHGRMPNQSQRSSLAHPVDQSNLLQYQQDLSLQQYLLARSLHSQRDPQQNVDPNATMGDNNMYRGMGENNPAALHHQRPTERPPPGDGSGPSGDKRT
jgi:hypothetical protein